MSVDLKKEEKGGRKKSNLNLMGAWLLWTKWTEAKIETQGLLAVSDTSTELPGPTKTHASPLEETDYTKLSHPQSSH